MNIKKYLFLSLLLDIGLPLTRRVVATSVPSKPATNNVYEAIDSFIESEMHRLRIPGIALAIVEDSKIVHLRSFGHAYPDGGTPSPQTPFMIGSLTKSFTALAVMQLVETGKINLDAIVQYYLPWFRVADLKLTAQITVRHLLNQTSGLPTSCGEMPLSDFDSDPRTTERQARVLSTVRLKHPPGTAFEYCNANYNLLGLIIEAVSGEMYAHYIQNYIFSPLDMSHSYTSRTIAKNNGLAMGHQYWFGIPHAAPAMQIPHGSLPAGLLISSSEDMAHYMIALLNKGKYKNAQIISAAGIEELHHGAADFNAMGLSLGQYGMGWFVDKLGGAKLVWHGGTLPDFAAYMALLPEQKKGVVLLFNASHHWMNPVLTDFASGVTALLAGEKPTPSRFAVIPYMLRGLSLVPVLQILGGIATLRMLHRWHLNPESRPTGRRVWGLHILLPLIANLLAALMLVPIFGKRRGYLRLYMPDIALIAQVCGGFALIWGIVRTRLVFKSLKKPAPSKPAVDSKSSSYLMECGV